VTVLTYLSRGASAPSGVVQASRNMIARTWYSVAVAGGDKCQLLDPSRVIAAIPAKNSNFNPGYIIILYVHTVDIRDSIARRER